MRREKQLLKTYAIETLAHCFSVISLGHSSAYTNFAVGVTSLGYIN